MNTTSTIRQRNIEAAPDQTIPDLYDQVPFLLRCASNIADAYFTKNAGDLDITPRQLGVLLALWRRPGITQTELAALTRTDRSTTNEMVPRMVERGLLVRTRSPADRRVFLLSISPQGKDLMSRASVAARQAHASILASLPAEYRKIFRHCLDLILQADGTT